MDTSTKFRLEVRVQYSSGARYSVLCWPFEHVSFTVVSTIQKDKIDFPDREFSPNEPYDADTIEETQDVVTYTNQCWCLY
jgi:hypothetical protein